MPLLMSNRGGICPPSKCAPAEFVNSIFLPLLKKGTRGGRGGRHFTHKNHLNFPQYVKPKNYKTPNPYALIHIQTILNICFLLILFFLTSGDGKLDQDTSKPETNVQDHVVTVEDISFLVYKHGTDSEIVWQIEFIRHLKLKIPPTQPNF